MVTLRDRVDERTEWPTANRRPFLEPKCLSPFGTFVVPFRAIGPRLSDREVVFSQCVHPEHRSGAQNENLLRRNRSSPVGPMRDPPKPEPLKATFSTSRMIPIVSEVSWRLMAGEATSRAALKIDRDMTAIGRDPALHENTRRGADLRVEAGRQIQAIDRQGWRVKYFCKLGGSCPKSGADFGWGLCAVAGTPPTPLTTFM